MVGIIDLINRSLVQCASWFVLLLESSGMTSFFLSMVFIALLGKYILTPLFGSGRGSDQVKRKSGSSGGDSDG